MDDMFTIIMIIVFYRTPFRPNETFYGYGYSHLVCT